MKRLSHKYWFILGSLIFLSIPIFSSPDFGNEINLFTIPMFLRMFASYVGVLAFFYINYFYLIPKFYFKRKYALFACSIIFIFLIVHYVPTYVFVNNKEIYKQPMPHRETAPDFRNKPDPSHAPFLPENIIFQFFLIVFISLLLRVNARLRQTENEKLRSEVAYLKAQINPHFLFNTLNSIYALTIVKSDSAPGAVVKLSNLMRYNINESSRDFVDIQLELNYIENFVGLQKLRLTKHTVLCFEIINKNKEMLKIAPLLLISFIENAFKYGSDPDNKSVISIFIRIERSILYLQVKNSIVYSEYKPEKNGIGINNSKERLSLLYPQSHKLEIMHNEKYFEVNLTLELHD